MIIPLPALAAYRRDLESLGSAVTSAPELDHALGGWVSFGSILESFLAEVTSAAQKNTANAVEQAVATYGPRLAAVADNRDPADNSTSPVPSTGHRHDLASVATLTRRVADAAEQRGALWLAYALLATVERAVELRFGDHGMTQRFEVASVGFERWEWDDHGPPMKTIVYHVTRAFSARNSVGWPWPIAWPDSPLRDGCWAWSDGSSVSAETSYARRGTR